MSDNTEAISKAIEVLKKGGIILYPTDTIWGIGCDATNFEAVEKINKLKSRATNKNYIILLDDDRKLNRYVREIPDVAWDIVEFSEKPTTIIYPNGYNVAENTLAKDDSLGIRIVKKGIIAYDLLRAFRKPIVSTSANISNASSPTSLGQIDEIIKNGVDYILEKPNGSKFTNSPSKIIKLSLKGEIEFIRK